MKELEQLLEGYNAAEKRSSLYYLSRYIKQAEAFENYQKDIFEDDIHSAPNETIRSLTINMINLIEKTALKKASEFNKEEFYYWMDQIAEIENNIDPKPNDEQVKNALDQLSKFDTPKKNL
jgi:hypothetical protein